ncbi:MAG: hypothetical protein H6828_02550 [Planctomycetes bacterium]|nr:hypothetical protein [Planctomycetota bacterium]
MKSIIQPVDPGGLLKAKLEVRAQELKRDCLRLQQRALEGRAYLDKEYETLRAMTALGASLALSRVSPDVSDEQFEKEFGPDHPKVDVPAAKRLPAAVEAQITEATGSEGTVQLLYDGPALKRIQGENVASLIGKVVAQLSAAGIGLFEKPSMDVDNVLDKAMQGLDNFTAFLEGLLLGAAGDVLDAMLLQTKVLPALEQAHESCQKLDQDVQNARSEVRGATSETETLFLEVMPALDAIVPLGEDWHRRPGSDAGEFLALIGRAQQKYGYLQRARHDWNNLHANRPELTWAEFAGSEVSRRDHNELTAEQARGLLEFLGKRLGLA